MEKRRPVCFDRRIEVIFCRLTGLSLFLLTSACSQIAFTTANLPSHFHDMVVVPDQAYGPEPVQTLDIYIPAGTKDRQFEVVVFFYGGRWTSGAKEDYRFIGATFTDKDFVVVIPDYRKYPQVRFPVFVEDGAKALTWVSEHITAFHGNPERIHVAGHSAGAHIGALLAADARYLANEGKERTRVIHDFVGLAGPYAFIPDEPDLEEIFGPSPNYPSMRVTTFIDGTQPPMLLLHGDADTRVRLTNLEKLEQRITQQGGCVQSKIYRDVSHAGILGALAWFYPRGVAVVDDILKFLHSCTSARSHHSLP